MAAADLTRPEPRSTAVVCAGLFVFTLCVLQVCASTLAASPPLTLLGGELSALCYFFMLMTLGNLIGPVSWAHVIISLMIACLCGASVHRVCVTSCVLFSAPMTYAMQMVSDKAKEAGGRHRR